MRKWENFDCAGTNRARNMFVRSFVLSKWELLGELRTGKCGKWKLWYTKGDSLIYWHFSDNFLSPSYYFLLN